MPPSKKARSVPCITASWRHEDRDRALLISYQRVVDEGRYSNGERGLKPGGWDEVARYFNEEIKLGYNEDQLRNHFNGLRKMYAQYDEFVRESGSGISANWPFMEAAMWDEVLQVKPKFRWIRVLQGNWSLYELCHTALGSLVVTGEDIESPSAILSSLAESSAPDDDEDTDDGQDEVRSL